jgi:Na+/H+-dicarboxylate symporter
MIQGTPFISITSEIFLKIGGYALVFTLIAGIPISVFRLSENRKLSKIFLHGCAFFAVSQIAAAGIGAIAAIVFKPGPLPLISESGTISSLNLIDLLRATFPSSIFSVFSTADTWLLPIALFALAFGLALSHDPVMSRPLLPVLEVISRAAYLINTFISEILGIILIPISLYLFLNLRKEGFPPEYQGIIVYAAIATLVLIALVFPLIYRIGGGKANPYSVLYGMLGPLLATGASSNIFFSAGTALRHVSESLGIKRDFNATIFPLGMSAGRIGSTFIVSASFISMFLSYSRNIPSIGQFFEIALLIPFSVLIGSAGLKSDLLAMLSLGCILFGQGFQNGASLLVPVALPLSIFAIVLDMSWIIFSTTLLAERNGERSSKKTRNFI